jgi:hypothetical protein
MVAIVALFCSGCKTTENTSQVRSVTVIPAPWHTVKIRAWPNTNTIHWYDKINPVWWVGNNEEPDPPAWYEPGNPCRRIYWRLRNPFTNFSYYVIGVADRDARRSGWYPKNVSNPNRGWNFAVTGVTKLNIPLLWFVDYRSKGGHFEFYAGWRERGNFGLKAAHSSIPWDPPAKRLTDKEFNPNVVFAQTPSH